MPRQPVGKRLSSNRPKCPTSRRASAPQRVFRVLYQYFNDVKLFTYATSRLYTLALTSCIKVESFTCSESLYIAVGICTNMEESERQKYEAQAQDLRVALKQFEGDWAKKNDGKKPPRQAIKANPIIAQLQLTRLRAAQKYKKYNQVRDILDGKIQPPRMGTKQRKSKPEAEPSQTPSERKRPVATPSKPQQHIDVIDTFETPSIRRLFSPTVPTSIGPTPQRNGRVLGLFDLLDQNDENTPSRLRLGETSQPQEQVHATPSKRTHAQMEADSRTKLGRTPQSSSKRNMLDSFMTPLKNRDGNIQDTNKTPSTTNKLLFSTPAFLRRAPLLPVDEHGEYVSPQPIRLPRKPLVRGLSSVVASLRKMEEDKLDDDLEALHEMENEEAGMGPPVKPANPVQANEKSREEILEPDSQDYQLLGGFDDEGQYDSEPEVQLGRDGQPLRVYRKRGQKRTTRKVNMRPTRAKRPQQSAGEPDSDGEDGVRELVPETQFDATKSVDDDEPVNLSSDSNFGASDGEEEGRPRKKAKVLKKAQPVKKDTTVEKDNPIKKAAKKVNAMAHANFKRLKLRNNGAKGGPGFGSKFRRRK
ncbi:DNA replication regulator sld2 [Seiridium cupressi]